MKALLLAALLAAPQATTAPSEPVAETASPAAPSQLYDVVRVVDGDTLHIQRNGEKVKLRLVSVDTEEVIYGKGRFEGTKPQTVFGTECAQWAQEFFEARKPEGAEYPRIGLAFPREVEEFDVYGRLLCHVLLEDGTDFNLHLVRTGKSPYFNKYGNSLIAHDEFVAAQESARAEQLGVWHPDVNVPKTPTSPSARRPYDRLLPWWDARAQAVDAFRAADATADNVAAADDPDALARVAAAEGPARIFGLIFKIYDEDDGSRTVLMRTGAKDRSLRVIIPADKKAALAAAFDLERTLNDFEQNYLWVTGDLEARGTKFQMTAGDPAQWSLAGPEPERQTD